MKIGEEAIVEINKIPVRFKRRKYGWIVDMLSKDGLRTLPVSMGNFNGESLDLAVAQARRFINAARRK